MTLEDILSLLTDRISDIDERQWEIADLCHAALLSAGAGHKKSIAGKLGEHCRRSSSWVFGRARAAKYWPPDAPERQWKDVDFSLFVLCAASRKARAFFERAVEEQWSIGQLRREIGYGGKRERCPTCGR